MKNKILGNLEYVICAALGLLQYILFAFPYVASFVKYDYGDFGGQGSASSAISGYNLMSIRNAGFGGVMCVIFQILVLILGILMLAYGVCGILKAFGLFEQFPDSLGKIQTKKIGEFALYGYAGLNVLLFIFMIVLCASNTEKISEGGMYMSAGIRFSVGIFFTLIFAAGAIVALKLVPKKFPVSNGPEVRYVCSKCGKKMRKNYRYCYACGGEVVEEIIPENQPEATPAPAKEAASAEETVPAEEDVPAKEPTSDEEAKGEAAGEAKKE